ncbi:MAG: T9SS type A sorting domain-containing protein, partial [Candidatus Eisenbacteria bacterium]|nr:T9SS type A sorting domain-containing protein [Candidatus Eisenbacteria bacterium]
PLSTRTDQEGAFELPAVPVGHYVLEVEMEDFTGNPTEIDVTTEDSPPVSLEVVPQFATEQLRAMPNPFREETSLTYRLAGSSHVSVAIFDTAGRQVRKLVDDDRNVGTHTLRWDGRDDDGRRLPQGIYYQRFAADGKERIQRLVVLR